MKRRPCFTIILLTATVVAGVGAAYEEMTPEEALSEALKFREHLSDYMTRFADARFEERISEAKVYSNFAATDHFYVFFSYWGPDDMPTWDDIERLIASDKKPAGKILVYYMPASRGNPNRCMGPFSALESLFKRESAEEYLIVKFLGAPRTYDRTVIESEGPALTAYFVYYVAGDPVLVDNAWSIRLPLGQPEKPRVKSDGNH